MKMLIIGQGLAGTLLGFRLEKAGHTVHYVDAPGQKAASSVAAGIINPITGRRFVKSWKIDELLPEAKSLYAELEQLLGEQFWYEMPLIRTLYNRGDANDWEARSGDAGYPEYMDDRPDVGRIPKVTQPVFAYAGVRHASRVDVGRLVTAFREQLIREGRFFAGTFAYTNIPSLLGGEAGESPSGLRDAVERDEGAKFSGLAAEYDFVICCEGWRARFNAWFNDLPHGGNKGEVLIVKTKAPILNRMFKHRVFLVPLTDDTYWIGATSENQFTDDAPSPNKRSFLADRLAEIMTTPYEILDHRAAVRPTVRDRRLFLGTHSELPRLAIFNGLGTKGASLAPLGSRWLAEHLLDGKPLPAEVDIRRFA